jgi:hypothetical protein
VGDPRQPVEHIETVSGELIYIGAV